MLIERLINNNMVLSKTQDGREAIVVGRGIGYAKHRGDEIPDEHIEKIFIIQDGLDAEKLLSIIRQTPSENIFLAIELDRYVREHYSRTTSETLVMILLDHVSAALRRYDEGIELGNPMLLDIRRIYPEEFEIGQRLVGIINRDRGVNLKEDEAGFIALNIVNALLEKDASTTMEVTLLVRRVLDIVQSHCPNVYEHADRSWFDRFLAHLKYLAIRVVSDRREAGSSVYSEALEDAQININHPETLKVMLEISNMLSEQYNYELSGDERFYLLIHLTVFLRSGGRASSLESEGNPGQEEGKVQKQSNDVSE